MSPCVNFSCGLLMTLLVPVIHPVTEFELNCRAPCWHVVCPAAVVCVDQRRRSTDVLPVWPIRAGEIIVQVMHLLYRLMTRPSRPLNTTWLIDLSHKPFLWNTGWFDLVTTHVHTWCITATSLCSRHCRSLGDSFCTTEFVYYAT